MKNPQNVHRASKRELSPRQVAEAVGVSESSLKRWCDGGLIPTRRTAGGHRRIPITGLVDFLRRKGFDPKRPDLLGLPAGAHRDERALVTVAPGFEQTLVAGDGAQVSSMLFGLYLAGRSVADLCDSLIAPTFHRIGTSWARGELEIYQERRAVELAARALYDLNRMLPTPESEAPLALSATLSQDPYSLAIAMIEVVMRELGWQASSLGPNHPPATLCAAIDHLSPRLLCLNISVVADRDEFVAGYSALYQQARAHDVALALGGPALDKDLRGRIRYTAHCESMAALVGLAESLWRRPTAHS